MVEHDTVTREEILKYVPRPWHLANNKPITGEFVLAIGPGLLPYAGRYQFESIQLMPFKMKGDTLNNCKVFVPWINVERWCYIDDIYRRD